MWANTNQTEAYCKGTCCKPYMSPIQITLRKYWQHNKTLVLHYRIAPLWFQSCLYVSMLAHPLLQLPRGNSLSVPTQFLVTASVIRGLYPEMREQQKNTSHSTCLKCWNLPQINKSGAGSSIFRYHSIHNKNRTKSRQRQQRKEVHLFPSSAFQGIGLETIQKGDGHC